MFKPGGKVKRNFSPIYLAILSGILLIILIINGFLEINRTKKGFYLLLEREGITLLKHYEKNVQETLTSLQWIESGRGRPLFLQPDPGFFFRLEESFAEYLLEAVHRLDQIDGMKPLNPSDLQSFVNQLFVTSIEIYDTRGTLLRGWPSPFYSVNIQPLLQELMTKKRAVIFNFFGRPLLEDHWFSIAIQRKVTPGFVALHFNGEQVRRFFRQWAIQRAISDISLREGLLFISIQDIDLNTLAHTDPNRIGRKEEDLFLKNSLGMGQPHSRLIKADKGEEVFEVAKSFSLKDKSIGLIRIGFSTNEIGPLLSQIKKNVILSIIVFLILGVSAIALIWVNQNRHFRKMKEMEDRIQLAERLSSLGHLAAGVAHEIRNPLNAIGMGLQRLKREFLPQDESKREEYLSFTDLILKEVRRVNEIIEQFLALSRPFQLNVKASSLLDLLNPLITLLQEEASSQNIEIQAAISPDLPPIKMDAEKLTQAFINIMKNGMQAMEHGGILRVETHFLRDRVEVIISDKGIGIPPDQMEKIFNYYYTTKEKGVGLGLPIAHRIIEAHGGELKVESQVGIGTQVTVTLPLMK